MKHAKLILLATVIALVVTGFVQTTPVVNADGPVPLCTDVAKIVGVTYKFDGKSDRATWFSDKPFQIPSTVTTTVKFVYREDKLVNYVFKAGDIVPVNETLGNFGTVHGCTVPEGLSKGVTSPDPKVTDIPGTVQFRALNKDGQPEPGTKVYFGQDYIVVVGYEAHIHGGTKPVIPGETVKAGSVATLFGATLPDGLGTCPYISGATSSYVTGTLTITTTTKILVPDEVVFTDSANKTLTARSLLNLGTYKVACTKSATTPITAKPATFDDLIALFKAMKPLLTPEQLRSLQDALK